MFLFFVVALVTAIVLVARGGKPSNGQGWAWFLAWAGASALFVFALATGFSIGIFFSPFAIIGMLWVGRRSPHWGEALGALVGFGFDLVLFADLSDWRTGWFAGCAAMLAGVFGYAQVLTRREARPTRVQP